MHLEVHGGGNLHALGGMASPRLDYECGPLHPFIDYDLPPPWLNTLVDPMDDESNVHISPEPALGQHINRDHITRRLADWPSSPATRGHAPLLTMDVPQDARWWPTGRRSVPRWSWGQGSAVSSPENRGVRGARLTAQTIALLASVPRGLAGGAAR